MKRRSFLCAAVAVCLIFGITTNWPVTVSIFTIIFSGALLAECVAFFARRIRDGK